VGADKSQSDESFDWRTTTSCRKMSAQLLNSRLLSHVAHQPDCPGRSVSAADFGGTSRISRAARYPDWRASFGPRMQYSNHFRSLDRTPGCEPDLISSKHTPCPAWTGTGASLLPSNWIGTTKRPTYSRVLAKVDAQGVFRPDLPPHVGGKLIKE
jgi:hypothetical protein